MRTAVRFGAWLPLLALAAAAGCGGRTGNEGFGTNANDAGLGGFAGSLGGYTGNAGYTGYSGGYVGVGGSFGGYVGTGGVSGCQGTPCLAIGCGPGQQQVTLPGQCCPTCQACQLTGSCLISSCGPGQQLTVPAGQCCPVCTGTTPCFGGPCPNPMCPPGSTSTTPPGQCCPVCVSDPCASVQCEPTACPPGSPTVTLPGQCCPSCSWPFTIDASVGPCDQNGYAQFLQKEMIALDALSCTTAADCMVGLKPNACSSGCGTVASIKSLPILAAQVNQFASANCSGCPPIRGGACGPYAATCVNGQCEILVPL